MPCLVERWPPLERVLSRNEFPDGACPRSARRAQPPARRQGSAGLSGTLIDASLVEADCRRPRKGEPVERRSDPDASWNAMQEQPLFGHKMHLAVDQSSGSVRQAILTPANVSDQAPFLDLVPGDGQAVYADRGYDGNGRQSWPREASPTASWLAATGGGRP